MSMFSGWHIVRHTSRGNTNTHLFSDDVVERLHGHMWSTDVNLIAGNENGDEEWKALNMIPMGMGHEHVNLIAGGPSSAMRLPRFSNAGSASTIIRCPPARISTQVVLPRTNISGPGQG